MAYLRCKMETGALLSLPSVLFNHATLDTDEAQWPRSDACVADALQHMEVGLVDFAWHAVPACTFFRVLHTSPEARKVVLGCHADKIDFAVKVTVCYAQHLAPNDTHVCVCEEGGRSCTLDGQRLCWHMARVLPALFRWRKTAPVPFLVLRSQPLCQPTLPAISQYDLPLAVDVEGDDGDGPEALVLVAEPRLTRLGVREAEVAERLLQAKALVADRGFVLAQDMDGVHVETLRDMERTGVVQLSSSEFGDLQVALQVSAVKWCHQLLVRDPELLSHLPRCCSPFKMSKLELMMSLRLEGWKHADEFPEAWSTEKALQLQEETTRPAAYFAALLDRGRLLQRGVDRIMHGMPAAYYECLSRLPLGKLTAFLASAHGEGAQEASHAWCQQQLRLSEEPAAETDLVQAVRALEDGAPYDHHEKHDVLQVHDPAEGGFLVAHNADPGWRRSLVDAGAGTVAVKVYFDHHTHSSGVQRGWVTCTHPGHASCIKYEVVTAAPTRELFCLRMYACFVLAASTADKASHLLARPTEQALQQLQPKFRMRDF